MTPGGVQVRLNSCKLSDLHLGSSFKPYLHQIALFFPSPKMSNLCCWPPGHKRAPCPFLWLHNGAFLFAAACPLANTGVYFIAPWLTSHINLSTSSTNKVHCIMGGALMPVKWPIEIHCCRALHYFVSKPTSISHYASVKDRACMSGHPAIMQGKAGNKLYFIKEGSCKISSTQLLEFCIESLITLQPSAGGLTL